MLFDTDLLIWIERGNQKAAGTVNEAAERFISIQSYMEFLQGVQSAKHAKRFKDFLSALNFRVLPFTENIGHRASIYLEEYCFSSGLRVGDAIIAATAVEHHLALVTGNPKDFRLIRDLDLRPFEP